METKEQMLTERKCEACTPDTPPLKGADLNRFLNRLDDGWELVEEHHLEKVYSFGSYRKALDFTVRIGEMSEEEGHHAEILLSWGKVKITVYTHAIDALSENDFIWAAKADEIYTEFL